MFNKIITASGFNRGSAVTKLSIAPATFVSSWRGEEVFTPVQPGTDEAYTAFVATGLSSTANLRNIFLNTTYGAALGQFNFTSTGSGLLYINNSGVVGIPFISGQTISYGDANITSMYAIVSSGTTFTVYGLPSKDPTKVS